jgi:hypothetical protein
MNWDELETAAPDLARAGRERLERTRVALLGTVRRDGSPRISPVEPVFAAGHLLFGVMRSAKGGDLQRDARCTLHSSVSDPDGTEGEFKLFGRAVEVEDPAVRDAGDGWWKSYPPDASNVYSLAIESAALVSWNFDSMTYELTRWTGDAGLTRRSVTYP